MVGALLPYVNDTMSDTNAEYVTDAEIETAIRQNDDPDHEDALTVADVRDLLAFIQEGVSVAWDTYMDHVEDGDAYVVHEDSDLVILATGEHNWISEELDHYDGDVEVDSIAKSIVTQLHDTVAKEHCDHGWGYAYPFVMVKPDSFDAGERYVTAVVNGLQARGLSPGQAWAYFGVEIRSNSMNNWGIRKGDHDHKNVSDALEKAKQKLPEA